MHTYLYTSCKLCNARTHLPQGADDDLVKVWSTETGQLLATLRGHSAEVTDISLSYDNSMIASGSLDKSVRVWCAQSSASLAVLTGHQGHVTSVQFSPSPIEEHRFDLSCHVTSAKLKYSSFSSCIRYLASAGKDGFLFFWQWMPESETFRYRELHCIYYPLPKVVAVY